MATRAHFSASGTAVLALLGAMASQVGCSAPRLPHPPYVSHPTAALEEVPYPPPPPVVETVPVRPTTTAVWIDGEWRYSGGQWRWNRGSWVTASAGLAFSPPVEVRSKDGTLYYAPGTWRSSITGEAVDDPDPLSRARGQSGNTVMNASGEREAVGRSRSQGGPRP